MGSLHEHHVSLWVDTTPETDYPPLAGTVEVDVAVIGGGIAGLSVATLLKRAGVRVAVVEAGRIASGATGYTTAKVTSQHGLMYRDLTERFSEGQARIYADANQAAIEQVAAFVDDLAIDCDFHRAAAHVYTEDPARLDDIHAEVQACRSLGLPASFTEDPGLPYPVQGAVRFDRQARFHPRKYCLALAAAIPGDGSHVFEMTRATEVEEGDLCEVGAGSGTVRARYVVLATQLPFLDRGAFFTRASPSRSYVLAARIEGDLPPEMYISIDSPARSLRMQEVDGGSLLLIGGEGHKVGQDDDTRQRYSALEVWAHERFEVTSIDYRWSAQDYMPVDNVPYIGNLTFNSERIYVATGFKKWGMTTGTVAGMVLSDAILGRENPWSFLFDSTRVNVMQSAGKFVTTNLGVAKELIGGKLGLLRTPGLSSLQPDEGRIVDIGGEDVAAYRDGAGAVHAVSPHCTHLGCVVAWNSAELSWDCPCHGSRFDYDGRVIQGPAVEDLKRKPVVEDTPSPSGQTGP